MLILGLGLALAGQDRTLETQAAVGRQMANQMRQGTAPVRAEVQEYVVRLGTGLAARLPSSPFPYAFLVVDQIDYLRAISETPGGYVFVPLSVLVNAKDGAEFARRLARAMARGPYMYIGPTGVRAYFPGPENSLGLFPMAYFQQHQDLEIEADRLASVAIAGMSDSAEFRRIQDLARPAPPKPRTPPSLYAK